MINQAQSLNERLIEIAARHKKKIILCPLFALVAGGLFFVFCPRTYRSEARLFLRLGRESVGMDPAATAGNALRSIAVDRENEVKSAQETFKSRSVASQVVDRVGPKVVLGRGPKGGSTNTVANIVTAPVVGLKRLLKSVDPISEREEAIIKLENNLSVKGERQSTVIVVWYNADSPLLAQAVCQAVVDVAQQEHIRVHRSDESSPFFTEQQQRLREQLDQSLESLRAAKDEMGLADVEQRRTALESQYNAIELDRLTSSQQLATAQARIENLQLQLAEIPDRMIASKRSIPNEGADLLRDRLYELQVKLMDLEARHSDTHPVVRAVTKQLEQAKKVLTEQSELRTETTDDVNPIHRDLSLSMKQELSVEAGFRSRLVELDKQKTAVLADLRTLNQHDLKMDQLVRETELARDKYMQYARTTEEARIDKALQKEGVSNISVAQSATLTETPLIPSRRMTVAGTFMLAVASTLGLVLLGEQHSGPLSAASRIEPVGRRKFRRRVRREFTPKSNGQSKIDEVPALPCNVC